FVSDGSYVDLVEKMPPEMAGPGEIVDSSGRVVGQHEGVMRFTVGQSKRLGNAARLDGERQMVVGVEPGRRRVVIGPREGSYVSTLSVRDVNWLVDAPPEGLVCRVQMRAREEPRPARVVPTAEGATVLLEEPAMPAPGQACVFYDGSRILGGGFIRRAEATSAA
ncbi:MAG: aminomethyltransferase beta-barrel domain-containing protein, partial [Acetobacter malorum]